MTVNNITILNDDNKIKQLLEEFFKANQLDTKKTLLITQNTEADVSKFDAIALPFEQHNKFSCIDGKNAVLYSLDNTSAEFVAINEQKHENNVSFELMTIGEMGRIFIDYSKSYTMQDVTPAAAALYAGGISLSQIIKGFNLILK